MSDPTNPSPAPPGQWPPRPIRVDSSASNPPGGAPAGPSAGGPAASGPRPPAGYRPPMGLPAGYGGAPPGGPPPGYVPPMPMQPARSVWFTIGKIFGIIVFVGCVVCTFLFIVEHVLSASFATQYGWIEERTIRGEGHDKIAVIPIKGMIDEMQVWGFHRQAEAAMDDDAVKAVVLDIDSGGGTVTGSEQIHQIVEKLKAGRSGKPGKTVVALYGGLAASGALYCSAAADRVYAQEDTLTGSIGVLTSVIVADKLLREKLGVDVFHVTSTDAKNKTLGETLKLSGDFSDADRAEVVRLLNHYHDLFVQRVFDGRKKNVTLPASITLHGEQIDKPAWNLAFVHKLADGSIYTRDEALDYGLVDKKGDLDDAINGASGMAGLSAGSFRVVQYLDPLALQLGQPLAGRDINLNVNIAGVESRDVSLSRGRFMYLSRYRR